MARFAIGTVGWHVAGERRGAQRARRTLAGVGTVVARIAPAGADRRVTRHSHRVGHKARRRIDMAIAALNSCHRDVRWRRQPGRPTAVVAA